MHHPGKRARSLLKSAKIWKHIPNPGPNIMLESSNRIKSLRLLLERNPDDHCSTEFSQWRSPMLRDFSRIRMKRKNNGIARRSHDTESNLFPTTRNASFTRLLNNNTLLYFPEIHILWNVYDPVTVDESRANNDLCWLTAIRQVSSVPWSCSASWVFRRISGS